MIYLSAYLPYDAQSVHHSVHRMVCKNREINPNAGRQTQVSQGQERRPLLVWRFPGLLLAFGRSIRLRRRDVDDGYGRLL